MSTLPLSLVNSVVEAPLSLPVAESNEVIFSLARTSHAIGFGIATVVNYDWKILPEDLCSSRGVIILLVLVFFQTLDTKSSFLSCVSLLNSIVCSTCSGHISGQSTVEGYVSCIVSSMPYFSYIYQLSAEPRSCYALPKAIQPAS